MSHTFPVPQTAAIFFWTQTGLRFKQHGRRTKYLFANEFHSIVKRRLGLLTLVFDQCVPRGNERAYMGRKLEDLQTNGVHCFAYTSHACFIVSSDDQALVQKALDRVISESRLPRNRFLIPRNFISESNC